MKILMLADLHFGVRSDSPFFRTKIENLFTQVVKYISDNVIHHVFILGDLMDKRKSCDYSTINFMIEQLERIVNAGCHIDILVGNHDSYFKNTLELNSPNILLKLQNQIKVYDKPTDVNGICVVPWICQDNYDECMRVIDKSRSKICFGHFELNGFQYNKSTISSGGMDVDFLKRFDIVLTGHYHIKSNQGKIYYLGTAIQTTWDDYNQVKGFHIFDTETMELTFVENPDSVFMILTDLENLTECKDKIIRIVIDSTVEKKDLDKYLQKVYDMNPHDVKVIHNEKLVDMMTEESDVDCVNTRQSIVNCSSYYIDDDMDEKKMNNIIDEVYVEAVNLK